MVYSMAGILCPQTSDTFPSFRATSGHRLSDAVESEIRGSPVPFRVVGLLRPVRRPGAVPSRFLRRFHGTGSGIVLGPRSCHSQDAAASMTLSSPSLTALITAAIAEEPTGSHC